jgi:hypothetical protein
MPGGTIYAPLKFTSDDDKDILFSSLSVFHHSNGQDHPEFKTNGEINTYNGNFSTNYIEPAFHFRSRRAVATGEKGTTCNGQLPGYIDVYGRVGGQLHFLTTPNLRSSYGNTRINIQLGQIWVKSYSERIDKVEVGEECFLKETDRFVLNSTLITGPRTRGLDKFKKRLNLEGNYYKRIPTSPNAAVFASAGYYGSDPYNIYFENSYFYFRFGLALGFFVYPGLQHSQKK